jgi:hypothetical protein
MRWIAFLFGACLGMVVLGPSTSWAEASGPVAIESIVHTVGTDASEKITLRLSGQVESKIFIMKGDNPRLVLDIPNSLYKGKGILPLADGKLATAIRAGLHQNPEQKTRIVVDLAKDIPVRHTSDYSATDNTISIDLFSEAPGPPQVPPAPAAAPPVVIAPTKSPEEVAAIPPAEPPVVPAVAAKESAKKPGPSPAVAEKTIATKGPQLLDVSFDDSSNRGEMVLFHLTDFSPPIVSALEKDNPRVLCDFMATGMGKGVEENIYANGKYVERIRTSRHQKPDKVRVELELTPDRDYDLQQVFFKNDNLFVLIINELPPDKATQEEAKP